MSWRNRKLFGNLPQGIISGLEPIPRYQMGGMVRGYEAGGSFPNKGLAALNKVAPDVVEKMGYENGGFINPQNYVNGGTVGMPIGMEAGALVPEVFESGDQQINEALNTMVATTMPTGDATTMPIGDATTTIPMEDPVGGVEMVAEDTTGDSSSKEALFMTQVNEQKNILQQTIERLITEKSQENLDPMNLKTQIGDFIVKADSLFKRKVTDIANKLNVEVLPEQVTLLTDDFAEKLEVMFPSIAALEPDEEDMQVASMDQGLEIPGMEEGGEVDPFVTGKIAAQEETVKRLQEQLDRQITVGDRGKLAGGTSYIDQAQKRLDKALERLAEFKGEGATAESIKKSLFTKPDPVVAIKEKEPEPEKIPPVTPTSATTTEPELKDLLGQSAEDIRNAALMTGKSKQGGVLGFMDVVGQSNLASAKADRENLQLDAKTEAEREIQRQKQFLQIATELDSQDQAIKAYVRAGMPLPKVLGITVPTGKVAGLTFSQYLDKNSDKTFSENLANFSAVAV
tara:strand:- start:21731 stop:23269 length:1539 start_codon:yes stop_codon:yes gene_type:complete